MMEEEENPGTLRPPSQRPTRPDSPVPYKPVPSSKRVSKQLIEPLLRRPERIRNVCILAHVDHGKTTLTDSLLASNGIISFKQAGTLRYMDAREDEQERGITMESSAVTLLYDLRAPEAIGGGVSACAGASQSTLDISSISKSIEGLSVGDRRFLINLIDSPGHVDFSSQVATAAKLCDGCLVLVDAVEGVCTQTASVLRQAYRDRLTPCLVINKMDRLVTELKLSSTEAAEWLFRLLARVNAVQATISKNMVEDDKTNDDELPQSSLSPLETLVEEETFCPSRGNVIFASATDGWAFRVETFAALHAKRLEMREPVLQQTLWGEYYFDPKGKRVVNKKGAERLGHERPMFAQFILDNIWAIYASTSPEAWDQLRIEKIALGLGVRLPLRELKSRDGRTVLRALMTSWLPLAETAFSAIVDQLPNPVESCRVRVPSLLHGEEEGEGRDFPPASQELIQTISSGDPSSSSSPTVAYLSKQFAVTTHNGDTDGSSEKLIGMARLFHGKLSLGQQVHVLGPKYRPNEPGEHSTLHTIKELFLLMGRDLEPVEGVYAGNVFGIGGLEACVGKSATLSSSPDCPSFDSPLVRKAVPIVRVALHAANVTQMDQLVAGLHLLCKADPCAESFLLPETGEYILAAAGELHLEQCLKDLRERFTRVEIDVSPPMVPFRETITALPAINDAMWREGLDAARRGEGAGPDGTLTIATPNANFRLSVKALPLSQEAVDFLIANKRALKSHAFDTQSPNWTSDFGQAMSRVLELPSPQHLLSLGPRGLGPNLLLASDKAHEKLVGGEYREFLGSIISGFQLAVEQGPLCAEPVMGVAFFLEDLEKVDWPMDDEDHLCCQLANTVRGQLISTAKDACHRAFLFRSPRLLLATYSCDIQTTTEVLGRVYSVVARRMGTILAEEYNDNTGFFTVRSLIPVIESFGFADDIRGRTSGLAIPQLLFHGFRLLDQDPFWVPTTEAELEDFGEIAEKANRALRYLIAVRERKGLFVEKKIVQCAEKQRTLKK